MINAAELLKKLSMSTGISGYEDNVGSLIVSELTPLVSKIHTNVLGSVICIKDGSLKSTKQTIMIAAHMDEIGLMVSGIEKGFLRICKVGGTDKRILLGQQVIVHGRKNLPGVIGTKPPHLLTGEQREKALPFEDLFVDVGMKPEEVVRYVRTGDIISFNQEAFELRNGYCAGKAFDDRAGLCAMLLCMEQLATKSHEWNVAAVATIQEEIAFNGAITSAFELNPDIAIVIDVTFGSQNGVLEHKTSDLGKGPVIALGPNIHPMISKKLIDVAQRLEIQYQIEPTPGSTGTDGWGIQVARSGIATGLVSIPVRYMHSPVETVFLKDIERTARLIAEFVCCLDSTVELSAVRW